MIEWAKINIQLLKQDRCSNILDKALTILDGLSSFFLKVIGTPHFPSLPTIKHINLFLWKVYLSNMYIVVDSLVEFFDLPLDYITTLGAKLITKVDSDDEAKSILRDINLNDIDIDNPIHESFLSETLIGFDQILKITTINTLLFQKEMNKHTTAAQNLKAKMKSIQTINATEATAQAIARATESIDLTKSRDLNANLRLKNLEKQVRKQDQRINEKFKNLQTNKTKEKKLQRKLHCRVGSLSSSTDPASPQKQKTKRSNQNNRPIQRRHRQQQLQLSNTENFSASQTTRKETEMTRRPNAAICDKKRKDSSLERRGGKQQRITTEKPFLQRYNRCQPTATAHHTPTKQFPRRTANFPTSPFAFQPTAKQSLPNFEREQQLLYCKPSHRRSPTGTQTPT